ncbi:DUF664 domain-containing protein [Actinomadura sp. 9N407]|uniref:mycothiol transferase n=1 Tax=Actinomadura sp. 9N407 TaxID=3375154 RepID=UPI00378C0141
MTASDPKTDLHFYLQSARDALLWKLEGLTEYDVRRPFTPTGTNILGLVKHAATVELGYLGDTFGRPSGEPLPWVEDGAVGMNKRNVSVGPGDSAWWDNHRSRLEHAAEEAARNATARDLHQLDGRNPDPSAGPDPRP